VGDSAAGKSTITRGLMSILGAEGVTHVCTDDYHKYDRQERAELGVTPLHPDSNYIDVLEQHLERLHNNQPILKPVYDHSTGRLVRPEYINPRKFVIVEGLLGFSTPVLRHFYDVKVYLSPPEEMRKLWKIKRDTSQRGYTREEVLEEMERREEDSQEFIRAQRQFADIVICFYPPEDAPADGDGAPLNVRLALRPTIPHPDLSYLLDTNNAGVRFCLGRDEGKPVDILEIDGGVAPEHARELEDALWRHLPHLRPVSEEMVGAYKDETNLRHSDPLGITQLLVAYHLLRKTMDFTHKGRSQPGLFAAGAGMGVLRTSAF
jgi:phosphoribulokinase